MMTLWTELLGQPFTQRFYNAGGIRTRVIETGEGEPLVFLHGMGGHAEAYVRNLIALSPKFHVYSIDMVGHGYSDHPDCSYQIMDFVNHLRLFLDAIGAKKANISGESLGAIVSALLAIEHPGRVNKLVLNTGLPIVPSEKGRRELLQMLELSRAATGDLTREAVRKRMAWLMLEPEKSLTDELVEVRYQIYSQPGMKAIMRQVAESVLATVTDPEQSKGLFLPDKLTRIKSPTLILWTRHNPGHHLDVAEQGAKLIPNARLCVFENSAHWPQWEEAEKFNSLHLEFLNGAD